MFLIDGSTLFLRFPLSIICILLRFIPILRCRLDFERQNLMDFFPVFEQLLSLDHFRWSPTFLHVSSEGELEQAFPLIEYGLNHYDIFILLITSPSVEGKAMTLKKNWSERGKKLLIYRVPLLSASPIQFLYFQSTIQMLWQVRQKSPERCQLVLVRYDFFPEFFFMRHLKFDLVLISAAWHRDRMINLLFLKYFNKIYAASKAEENKIKKAMIDNFGAQLSINIKWGHFDLRTERIFNRQEDASLTLKNKFPALEKIFKWLSIQETQKILLMGNAWVSDLEALWDDEVEHALLSKQLKLVYISHQTDAVQLEKLEKFLLQKMSARWGYKIWMDSELTNPTTLIDEMINNLSHAVHIIQVRGVLCEAYTYFSHVYVGGSFERSIHSVSEPYIANCQIFVGPKVSRSTEYRWIVDSDPSKIQIVYSFKDILKQCTLTPKKLDPQFRLKMMQVINEHRQAFLCMRQ